MYNNLKFRVGALVLGVTLAVAGSAFKPAEKSFNAIDSRVTGWFATDRDGDLIEPYQQVDPEELCHGGDDFCAKEYNIENGEPVSETSSPAAMRPEL